MRDEMPGIDPKTIWQRQPTEASTMTLEKVRKKARALQGRTRRELFGSVSLVLIVIGVSGAGILVVHDPRLRGVFALAIAWALAGQLILHRGMWSRRLPGDAALSTGFEFYRQEINRQRHVFGGVVQWSFGPLVLSIFTAILAMMGIARKSGVSVNVVMPFCTLFAVWIVAVFVLRWRSRRELQRDVDELIGIEKESGG